MDETYDDLCRKFETRAKELREAEKRLDGQAVAEQVKQSLARDQQDERDRRISDLVNRAFASGR
jgi:hypothetical protein